MNEYGETIQEEYIPVIMIRNFRRKIRKEERELCHVIWVTRLPLAITTEEQL